MSAVRKARVALVVLGLAGGLAVAPASAFARPANPPGNNGTVKIDARPFDDAPNNEPHVGCNFQVDFYGFDKGNYNAMVTFSVQPPTGHGTVLLTDSVFIGGDAAGGGTDLDASKTYRLMPLLRNKYVPHPQQGYHIKLKVNAPGSIGADTKFKVFWVQPCESSGGETGGGETGGGSDS